MRASHEHPLSADAVAARLDAAALHRAVVATGQYSPEPSRVERLLVYDDRDRRLAGVIDAWVTVETRAEVLRSLSAIPVATGSCSAMYATRAKYVWAARGGELRLWRYGRLAARFARDRIALWAGCGRWSPWPIDGLRVHGFLSATWVERGVRLEHADGRSRTVARARELAAWLDPTYDGIDLMCDAGWVIDLARAIADAGGAPLELDEGLR